MNFVAEVFQAVHTKSYKANYVPPNSVPINKPPLATPAGSGAVYGSLGTGRGFVGSFQESRKRSFTATHENNGKGDSHYARGDRQVKQLRRGGRGGRGDGFGSGGGRSTSQEVGSSLLPEMLPMPLPEGLFDPHDPMGAMMAMQALGLPSLPGMPPLPQVGPPNGHHQFGGQGSSPLARLERRERCRDYDMQGFCTRGDTCPYEHGNDRLIAPGQDGR